MAGDGPDLEKYQALAKELGVDDRAVFPGWCDNRSALLNIADVWFRHRVMSLSVQ